MSPMSTDSEDGIEQWRQLDSALGSKTTSPQRGWAPTYSSSLASTTAGAGATGAATTAITPIVSAPTTNTSSPRLAASVSPDRRDSATTTYTSSSSLPASPALRAPRVRLRQNSQNSLSAGYLSSSGADEGGGGGGGGGATCTTTILPARSEIHSNKTNDSQVSRSAVSVATSVTKNHRVSVSSDDGIGGGGASLQRQSISPQISDSPSRRPRSEAILTTADFELPPSAQTAVEVSSYALPPKSTSKRPSSATSYASHTAGGGGGWLEVEE